MTQDRLKEILDTQRDFQRNFFNPDEMTDKEKIQFTKENMLALYREIGETLNELPWKIHRDNNADYNLENIHEELIDCFKFFLNLCIIWGIDDDKLYSEFKRKTEIVQDRFNREKDNIEL